MVPDRIRLRDEEFAILTTLGAALGSTKGYGAPETKIAYMRARDISAEIGDVERKLPALFGVWANFYATGQHKESWKSLHEFMRIAKDHRSEDFNSVSQWMLIQELIVEGKFNEAMNVCEKRLNHGIDVNDDKLALEIGEHPRAMNYGVSSEVYLFLGKIDQSIEIMNNGMQLSKSSNHTNSIAGNMCRECVLFKCRFGKKLSLWNRL